MILTNDLICYTYAQTDRHTLNFFIGLSQEQVEWKNFGLRDLLDREAAAAAAKGEKLKKRRRS